MNTSEILFQADRHTQIIAHLKRISDYYPAITFMDEPDYVQPNKTYASTLVRIFRNEKWYTVHCVESYIGKNAEDLKYLMQRMMKSVHQIQNLWVLTGKFEDLDKYQLPEEERLKQKYLS